MLTRHRFATVLLALSLSTSFIHLQGSIAKANDASLSSHPFTTNEAQLIHDGKIVFDDGSDTGLVDKSLINSPVLDPQADDDLDGIPNAQELHVYTKNGKQYLRYLSHPKLKDTDGDGLIDKTDPDPLAWDMHARDAVMFARLTYRDDDYVTSKIFGTSWENTFSELPEADWYNKKQYYSLMHRELGPFWALKRSWHESSGFDAQILEFSNRYYPYLKNGATNMFAIRGTQESKDYTTDMALAVGTWSSQATSVLEAASYFGNNSSAHKNLYVTGHSLGGYLSQLFITKSVGNKFGFPTGNDQHKDWNYWDKQKYDNPEIKQVWGFNSPRIKCSYVTAKQICEYYNLSAYLTTHFSPNPIYYQVNNDSVVKPIGYPDHATFVGNTDSGHSMDSYFEDKLSHLPGFQVNARNSLSNNGYQEPALKTVRFVKPTTVNLLDADNHNKLINTKVFAISEKEIQNLDLNKLLGEGYKLPSNPAVQYGKINDIPVQIKRFNITYNFMVDNQVVDTVSILVPYKHDYQAPAVPVSKDPDYKYVLQVTPIDKVKPEQITQDRTITVHLLKEPVEVSTVVNFVDGSKTVKTITKKTKPSEGEPKLLESDYPVGYVIPSPLPTLTAGKTNDIPVEKQTFTLKFRYVDISNNTQIGDATTEIVKYGEDSKYQLQLPANYQLADGYAFRSPTAVQSNQTVDIKIQKIVPNTWQLRFIYKFNGKTVGTQNVTTRKGETVNLVIPKHPEAANGKSYLISQNSKVQSPYTTNNDRPSSGVQELEVLLSEKIPASIISPDPVIHYYTVTVNYTYKGKIEKTETLTRVAENTPLTFTLPTSSRGTYKINNLEALPKKVTKNETITVNITFEPNIYNVTVRYIYTSNTNGSTLVNSEEQQVKDGDRPVIRTRINGNSPGRYYQPKSNYQPPIISGPAVVDVPLEYIVKSYTVSIVYTDNGVPIGDPQIQTVKEGETAALHLPAAQFDGYYLIDPKFSNPVIMKDQNITVPLVRYLNTYRVTLNYQFAGKNIITAIQTVKSGSKATDVYSELLAKANGEEKDKLSLYQVDPAYVFPTITQDIELVIPLQHSSLWHPTIVQGANQTWRQLSGKEATFKSDGTYDSKQLKVLVDGKEIQPQHYTHKAGSIIVNIQPTYLDTLALGTHTLAITSTDGTASTNFVVLPANSKPASPVKPEVNPPAALPNNGAETTLILWLSCWFMILGTVCLGFLCMRKYKNNN